MLDVSLSLLGTPLKYQFTSSLREMILHFLFLFWSLINLFVLKLCKTAFLLKEEMPINFRQYQYRTSVLIGIRKFWTFKVLEDGIDQNVGTTKYLRTPPDLFFFSFKEMLLGTVPGLKQFFYFTWFRQQVHSII